MKFLLYNNKLQTLEKELKHFYASMAIFYVIHDYIKNGHGGIKMLEFFLQSL